MKHILDLSLKLMIVCLAASAGLASVYKLTAERIKLNARKEVERNLFMVLPGSNRFEQKENKFEGFADDQQIGTAVELAPKGYGGKIKMLAGIDRNGTLIAIAILSHTETPGLGKNIEMESFKRQFKGKSHKGMFLKKDSPQGEVDAITAATISSRAVTDAVRKALQKFNRENKF
ncbi:MAG: RnfABCDGE type electron transport complex subunit G [bacterium]